MSSPVGDAFHAQRCGRLATPRKTGTKKGAASVQPLSSLGQAERHSNHCPLELKPVALSPRFLFFLDLLSPASAAAPLEQHPAEEDLVPEAPLVSAEAEAPLEQQLADLDLSLDATLPSVEAEAPWSSSWQTWTCRKRLFGPWSKFAQSWPCCRRELPWIGLTQSTRRMRRRRGKGTCSLCC